MAPTPARVWWLSAALLLGGLTLGVLRPQAAYPEWATLVTTTLFVAALPVILVIAPPGPPDRPWAVAVAGALAWLSIWVLGVWRAPVEALGRPAIILIAQGCLVFLAVGGLARAHGGRAGAAVVWWMAGLATLMALHGLYQVHGTAAMPGSFKASEAALLHDANGIDPELLEGILHAVREGRASSWWGSPNIFAGLLAAALPAVVCLALRHDHWRWTSLGAFAVCVWALLLTGSRGGLMGAMAGLGIFGLLLASSMRRRVVSITAVTSLIATALVWLPTGIAFARDADASARWLGTSTIGQRLMYWESAWAIWRENPLLGRGPGAFVVFYPQHRPAAANETLYAHSWLFDWGCQVGLVGLGAFLVWVAASLARARGLPSTPLRAGLVGCVAAMLVHGLVEFTLQVAEMYLLLALVLGVIAGGARMPGDGETEATAFRPGLNQQESPGFYRELIVRFLLVGACSIAPIWHRPAARAEALRDLIPWVGPADTEAIIEQAISAEPDHPTAWESKGLWLLQRGDLAGAEAAIEQARRLHPYSARLCESLGRVRVEQGRLDEAIALQREAIARHPVDIEHRLRLVELLLAAGDNQSAQAAFDETLATTRTRNAREIQWRDAVAARLSGS